jgi:hypothetical protein
MIRVLAMAAPLVTGCKGNAQEKPSQLISVTVNNRAFCHRGTPLSAGTARTLADQIWTEYSNCYPENDAMWGNTPAEQQSVDAPARTAIIAEVKAQIIRYLQNNSASLPIVAGHEDCPNSTPTADTLLTPASVHAMVRAAVAIRLAGGTPTPAPANNTACTTADVNTCLTGNPTVRAEVLHAQAPVYDLCANGAVAVVPASVRQGAQNVPITLQGFTHQLWADNATAVPADITVVPSVGSRITVVSLALSPAPAPNAMAPSRVLIVTVNVDANAPVGHASLDVRMTGRTAPLATASLTVTRRGGGGSGNGGGNGNGGGISFGSTSGI